MTNLLYGACARFSLGDLEIPLIFQNQRIKLAKQKGKLSRIFRLTATLVLVVSMASVSLRSSYTRQTSVPLAKLLELVSDSIRVKHQASNRISFPVLDKGLYCF